MPEKLAAQIPKAGNDDDKLFGTLYQSNGGFDGNRIGAVLGGLLAGAVAGVYFSHKKKYGILGYAGTIGAFSISSAYLLVFILYRLPIFPAALRIRPATAMPQTKAPTTK